MLLEVKDVGFVYQTPEREKEALKDVSFTIGQGRLNFGVPVCKIKRRRSFFKSRHPRKLLHHP